MRKRWYLFVLLIPLGLFALGAIIMFLWNALLPAVIHVSTITIWQALGLFILSRILFGGYHHSARHRYPYYRRMHHFKEKWDKMTEEEREKYKEEWKKHFDAEKGCC
ncbi:MAG: hypothetical protein U0W24_24060 [Bacteroidales bacterium]